MQVTHATLPALMPEFIELLQSCDFYALDEEMTGITVPEVDEKITFTVEECYAAKRLAAQRYSMIQIGICLFHKQCTSSCSASFAPSSADSLSPQAKRSRHEDAVEQERIHYIARPFNFIIFPDSKDGTPVDGQVKDVVLSPSGLNFLRKQGMDFQRWIYNGVTLCNAAQAEVLRAAAAAESGEAAEGANQSVEVFLTAEEEQWVDAGWHAAQELVGMIPRRTDPAIAAEESVSESDEPSATTGSGTSEATAIPQPTAAATKTETETGEKEKDNNNPQEVHDPTCIKTPPPPSITSNKLNEEEVLLPCEPSRHARQTLLQRLQSQSATRILTLQLPSKSASAATGGGGGVLLRRMTEKERAYAALCKVRSLPDKLGFRLIFEALQRSRKPCVGHNCFADLLFLSDALDSSLPNSLTRWCNRVHRDLLPCVYDTRYIAGRLDLFDENRFKYHYLGGLFEAFGGLRGSSRVKVTLPLGFAEYDAVTLLDRTISKIDAYTDNKKTMEVAGPAHEAAYDALMTGTVFINLLAELGVTSVTAAPVSVRNKLAVFNCLYALNLDCEPAKKEPVGSSHDSTPRVHVEASIAAAVTDEHATAGQNVESEDNTNMDSDTRSLSSGAARVSNDTPRAEEEADVLQQQSALLCAEYLVDKVLDIHHDATVKRTHLWTCLSESGIDYAKWYSVDATRTLAVLPRQADVATVAQMMSSQLGQQGSVREYEAPHMRQQQQRLQRAALNGGAGAAATAAKLVQGGCGVLKSVAGGNIRTILHR